MKGSSSPDIIHSGWLGAKHQLTNYFCGCTASYWPVEEEVNKSTVCRTYQFECPLFFLFCLFCTSSNSAATATRRGTSFALSTKLELVITQYIAPLNSVYPEGNMIKAMAFDLNLREQLAGGRQCAMSGKCTPWLEQPSQQAGCHNQAVQGCLCLYPLIPFRQGQRPDVCDCHKVRLCENRPPGEKSGEDGETKKEKEGGVDFYRWLLWTLLQTQFIFVDSLSSFSSAVYFHSFFVCFFFRCLFSSILCLLFLL